MTRTSSTLPPASSDHPAPAPAPARARLALRVAGLAASAALVAALSACGGGMNGMDHGSGSSPTRDGSGAAAPTASPSVSLERDKIDVEFAQAMIPHHQQALEMAEMAATRAQSPEVKRLAAEISAAQGPEIATMTSWLKAWGEDVPAAGGKDGMDHGSMDHGMPGMMTAQEMAALEKAKGAAFDRLWLTQMIKHHQGAIEMAEGEQKMGKNPQAKALAATIAADQAREIAVMKGLLSRLG